MLRASLLLLLALAWWPPPGHAQLHVPAADLRPLLVTAPGEQQLECTLNLVGSIQRASPTARIVVFDIQLSTEAHGRLRGLDGVSVVSAHDLDPLPAAVLERALEIAVSAVYVEPCLEIVHAAGLREVYEAVQSSGWFWTAVEVQYLQPKLWCSDAILGARRGSWGHAGVARAVVACRGNATCWNEVAHVGDEGQRLYALTFAAVRAGLPCKHDPRFAIRRASPAPPEGTAVLVAAREPGEAGLAAGAALARHRKAFALAVPFLQADPRKAWDMLRIWRWPANQPCAEGDQAGPDADLIFVCVGACGAEAREQVLANVRGVRCFREVLFFQTAGEAYEPANVLRQLLGSDQLAAAYAHLFFFGPELRVVRRGWLDALRHAAAASAPFWALASPFDDGAPDAPSDPADGRRGYPTYVDGCAIYSLAAPFREYAAAAGLLDAGSPLFAATFVPAAQQRQPLPALVLREAAVLGAWPRPAAVRAMFRYGGPVRSVLHTAEAAAGLGAEAPGAYGAPSLAAWPGGHDDGAYLLSIARRPEPAGDAPAPAPGPPPASLALQQLERRLERARRAQWEHSGADEAAAAAAVRARQSPAGGCGPQTRALVVALSKFYGGLGAVLQWLVAGLQYAAASDRTLVVLEDGDPWVWAPADRCGPGRTWSCFFEPLSACTAADVWPSGVEVPLSTATEGERVVHLAMEWEDPAPQDLPPEATAACASRSLRWCRFGLHVPAEFEHRGALWWKAQLAAFLFRPLPHVRAVGDEARAAMGWASLPLARAACVHVRRGDKIRGPLQEAFPLSLADYAGAVRALGGAVGHVFLATDDPTVVAEMAALLPGYGLVADGGERRSDGAVLKIWGGDPRGPGAAIDPLYEVATAVKNLALLSECAYFVGTFSSQFSRFAYLLKFARGLPHAVSLDDPVLARLP